MKKKRLFRKKKKHRLFINLSKKYSKYLQLKKIQYVDRDMNVLFEFMVYLPRNYFIQTETNVNTNFQGLDVLSFEQHLYNILLNNDVVKIDNKLRLFIVGREIYICLLETIYTNTEMQEYLKRYPRYKNIIP